MDPYALLGVDENATDEQIKKAYHDSVKRYHPDKYKDNPLKDLAEERFKKIVEAYGYIMELRNSTHDVRNFIKSDNSYVFGFKNGGFDQRTINKAGFSSEQADKLYTEQKNYGYNYEYNSSFKNHFCYGAKRKRRRKNISNALLRLCCSYLEGECLPF
jgi:curved DNA-binding protein CbpA